MMIYDDLMGFMFFFPGPGLGWDLGWELKSKPWPSSAAFGVFGPIFGFFSSRLPSGEHTKNYGKTQFMVGKLTISMAMLPCSIAFCMFTRPGSLCSHDLFKGSPRPRASACSN